MTSEGVYGAINLRQACLVQPGTSRPAVTFPGLFLRLWALPVAAETEPPARSPWSPEGGWGWAGPPYPFHRPPTEASQQQVKTGTWGVSHHVAVWVENVLGMTLMGTGPLSSPAPPAQRKGTPGPTPLPLVRLSGFSLYLAWPPPRGGVAFQVSLRLPPSAPAASDRPPTQSHPHPPSPTGSGLGCKERLRQPSSLAGDCG